MAAGAGPHVQHPSPAELQRQLLQGRELFGGAEEVGKRHLVPLEVVIDHHDRVMLTAVVSFHGRGMRFPGVQVHAVVTAKQGTLVC